MKELEEVKEKIRIIENLLVKKDEEMKRILENLKISNHYDDVIQETSQGTLCQNVLITNLELHTKSGHVLDKIPQLDGVELVKETFNCENCRQMFATQQLLDYHVHEYDYVCDECSLCFKGQSLRLARACGASRRLFKIQPSQS